MRSANLGRIAQAIGADLQGSARIKISSVGTDTRELGGVDLFVALKGEKFDGHAFLGEIPRSGVKAAVVERGNALAEQFRGREPLFPLLRVDDTLGALGDLAAFAREGLDVIAIGITGSTGKTCTKDILVAALEKDGRVTSSRGSFNNEIGVPLTVLSASEDDRFLVTEMGARNPGDIGRLCRIARPSHGIITNVGVTHLELFVEPEAVAATKAELAEDLPGEGVLFLNRDNEWSEWIARRTKARVVTFGYSRRADYRASGIRFNGLGRPTFTLRGPGFSLVATLPLIGMHQVENSLAAVACAHTLGMQPSRIAEALQSVEISPWRMQPVEGAGGFLVLNDSYNANPHSMRAALEALKGAAGDRRTIAVLGGMAELGSASRQYHREAGRDVAELDIDILIAVGSQAREYTPSAIEAGLTRGSVFRCEGIEDALELLACIVEPGDVVLVKGSRVVGLERAVERLADPAFEVRQAVIDV